MYYRIIRTDLSLRVRLNDIKRALRALGVQRVVKKRTTYWETNNRETPRTIIMLEGLEIASEYAEMKDSFRTWTPRLYSVLNFRLRELHGIDIPHREMNMAVQELAYTRETPQ